jgi:hypothetical protein
LDPRSGINILDQQHRDIAGKSAGLGLIQKQKIARRRSETENKKKKKIKERDKHGTQEFGIIEKY